MTTSTHPETEIAADPDVPIIRVVREFDAPPQQVFHAHVDPELVVQWLGPRKYEMDLDHWDARTGGSYRYVHRAEGEEYAFHGSFHDVREDDHTIVQTFNYEAWPDAVTLERMVLTELDGGRTRLEATSLFDSYEAREGMLASGMEVGINEGYDRLDELLAD